MDAHTAYAVPFHRFKKELKKRKVPLEDYTVSGTYRLRFLGVFG
jgi:hypothetical protein